MDREPGIDVPEDAIHLGVRERCGYAFPDGGICIVSGSPGGLVMRNHRMTHKMAVPASPGQLVGLVALLTRSATGVDEGLLLPPEECTGESAECEGHVGHPFAVEHPPARFLSKRRRVSECHVHLRGSRPKLAHGWAIFRGPGQPLVRVTTPTMWAGGDFHERQAPHP
jgi:hypothetical protein